ncbi:MAG: phage tail tape measure protein [Lachnospiraceae bacterium]|nr:phage tail tape measure protein [Lachnospiraceae bacterium]
MENSDLQVLLQAVIDAKDIQEQLSKINDLSVHIQKLNLDRTAIKSLKEQLSKAGIDLNLVLGNNTMAQASKSGQQIGKIISDNAQKAIDNASSKSIGKYFKIDPSTSSQFNAEMDKLVSKWTNSKGLHHTTVTYENELIDRILSLTNGGIKNDYSTQIAKLAGNFRSLGLSQDEINTKLRNTEKSFSALEQRMNQPFDKNDYQEIISLNDKLQKELAESSNEYAKLQAAVKGLATTQQRLNKANEIEAWNQKNSAATSETIANNKAYINSLRDLNTQMTKTQFNNIADDFKKSENAMPSLNKLGIPFKEQMSQAAKSLASWFSVNSAVMMLVSKTRSAISEIKELDNTLTEISKTSDITAEELRELGMSAYNTASSYGRTANDYLSGVKSMSQSGFYGKKGEAMAEQSLLAQSAGDMSQEIADKYVIATNAAYKFNGAAEKINAVLNGQNSISNRNGITLEDMATAMNEASIAASSYNVAIEDLSAMIGTMEAVTKSGGPETGNSIKSILINLQNITSNKIPDTLEKANASMTEVVNGAEKLRNPVAILRDLAVTFNKLDEDNPLRAEILTNVAGNEYQAAKLTALLENMEMFDKMLSDYSEGAGSALEEANKSSTNLTGSLNALSNSWTGFVNSIITSDGLKTGVNLLNSFVQGITELTNVLGSAGTLGLGAGLFAGIKNVGRDKMFSLLFI